MARLIPFILFILCALCSGAQSPDYTISLINGDEKIEANFQDFIRHYDINNQNVVDNQFFKLIQFEAIPDKNDHITLEESGIKLLNYLPENAYFASISSHFNVEKIKGLKIRSIVDVPPHFKLNQHLYQHNIPEWAKAKNDVIKVNMLFYRSLDKAQMSTIIESDGFFIEEMTTNSNWATLHVHEDMIGQLTALPYVYFVETIQEPAQPEGLLGKTMHRSNIVSGDYGVGFGYDGTGVSVCVRDDGGVGPHIDFTGRKIDDYVYGGLGANTTHGDMVSGIFCGAGNINPDIKGMAPGANLYLLNYEADFLDNTLMLYDTHGMVITNSSYSNGCNSGYTTITETVDRQIYENQDLLHVFSAGNSNNSDCGYGAGNQWGNITGGHKQGKNVIATANLDNTGLLQPSSSRGPASDGRIKPDISAHGHEQMSTDPNNVYEPGGGTSAAAPSIAGVAAQLYHAYKEYNNGNNPPSGLIKSLILNTAFEKGNIGPDYQFGWGVINGYHALQAIMNHNYEISAIDQDQTMNIVLNVPAGIAQAKFMIYWMDQSGAVMGTKALVNDIDLTVTDPSNNEHLPWLLDHNPTPADLNKPATKGEDHLNNVEQVAIEFPEPGDYILNVKGTTLPFGAHYFIVTHEYIDEGVELTYPFGGESFTPGGTQRIHWDAFGEMGDFTIEYADENGSWNQIATVDETERLVDWAVPASLMGKIDLRITRGNFSDTTNAPVSVMRVPSNIRVDTVCAEWLKLNWNPVPGAIAYSVYTLGEKYMEPIDTTNDAFMFVPIKNPKADNWLSVQAHGEDGLIGKRSVAIVFRGGLRFCDLSKNLVLQTIFSPIQNGANSCDIIEEDLIITIRNRSDSIATNFEVGLQINNEPPVYETYTDTIPINGLRGYTFTDGIKWNKTGTIEVKAWSSLVGDQAKFDDTLRFTTDVLVNNSAPESVVYFRDMENTLWPPTNWLSANPDQRITWGLRNVIGSDNTPTTAIWIPNNFYENFQEEDYFIIDKVDLTTADNPYLAFDIFYIEDQGNADRLLIQAVTDCSLDGDYIFDASGANLATASSDNVVNTRYPQSDAGWVRKYIDLADYKNDEIQLIFTSVNQYGSNLFLDNIEINDAADQPIASFDLSSAQICVGDAITVTNQSIGEVDEFEWNFGTGQPSTANSAGPHTISFDQPGPTEITLIITIGGNKDTITQTVDVLEIPLASFTYTVSGTTVTFTNTSAGLGGDVFWLFGDATTSTLENPVHTYSYNGVYNCQLFIINACGTNSITIAVNVNATSIENVLSGIDLDIHPNPVQDFLTLSSQQIINQKLSISVSDVTGKNLIQVPNFTFSGTHEMDVKGLLPGVYMITISSEDSQQTFKFVKT